jgi:hypothetical protein
MQKTRLCSAVVAVVLLMGPVWASAQAASQAATEKEAPVTYKLDFLLTEIEGGKKINSRNYTLLVQEDPRRSRGHLRVGSRVPIVTNNRDEKAPSVQYMDVGVNIDCQLYGTDDNLTFNGAIEVSSISVPPQGSPIPNPVVRQMRTDLTSWVPVGKPFALTSVDELDTPRKMEVQVTVARAK